MQEIIPHLWFDKEAGEAARFYTDVFSGSSIKKSVTLHDTPSGTVDLFSIILSGFEFKLISAGPFFKFNPSISFLAGCDTVDEVDRLWNELYSGGTQLMPLGSYPFSERYGWVMDRYGLSWQIMHMGERNIKQKIIPTIMFSGDNCGRAEEAIRFYTTVFANSKMGEILRYGENEGPDREGTIKHINFILDGVELAAMDSARVHNSVFNEAISMIVNCNTQDEIDFLWNTLSASPEAEACGWLKDRYGLSWQITPAIMDEMMSSGDSEKIARVTEAFLKMKKFDISEIVRAYQK